MATVFGGVPWGEARDRAAKYREAQWERRARFIAGPLLTCPSCKRAYASECEVMEWDTETFEPIRDSVLAPTADCLICDLRLFQPYDIVETDLICHECRDEIQDEVYASGRWFCSEECRDECLGPE